LQNYEKSLVGTRSLLLPEKKARIVITTGKKKGLFICLNRYNDWKKKKDTVVCLAGSRSLLQPENIKVPVVCLAGARSLLRPEKKRYSRLSRS
jgi:hypothetical protein